ncbi:MAG: hypothetical protein HOP19_11870 [Acidobacteria bacterium]|nr:hypothetical protein [Acidobacteriota bacterium]
MQFKKMFQMVITMALLAGATFTAQAQTPVTDPATEASVAQGADLVDVIERIKQAQIKAFAGSWEGVLTPEDGGPPPFRILFTFGADGTVVVSDAGPPTPQNNTTEHGAWERTGDREFTIVYKQFLFNAQGELDGSFKGRVRFKLDEFRKEITGVVKVDIYDPEGHSLIAGTGTIKCTKIQIESLD